MIASGRGALIGAFVTAAGIIVVDDEIARLIDRDGGELARFGNPGREITAAAFDGAYLGIADRAELTMLRPDLTEIASVLLPEPCASAVVVSGHRLVCGTTGYAYRVFTTYDMVAGTVLAMSMREIHNGIAMTRVPGRDYFVTVRDGVGDFGLYGVLSTGATEYLGDSPYHGDFAIQSVFAFIGGPATHIATHEGLVFRIFAPACETRETETDRDCFAIDGDLGILPLAGTYTLMTQDDAGFVYGLKEPADHWFTDPFCVAGCEIHRVDPAAGIIVSRATYSDEFLRPVLMTHDATSSALLLGVHTLGDSFHGYSAYEVRRASYE